MNNRPNIFQFSRPRQFVAAFVEFLRESKSLREIVKEGGISNPNTFRLLEQRQRNFTVPLADKIAKCFDLAPEEKKYLMSMVQIDLGIGNPDEHLVSMRAQVKEQSSVVVKDVDIHASWLHGVIFEMARFGQPLEIDGIQEKLRTIASKEEIESSLQFLLQKGWLVETDQPDVYQQADIEFKWLDDVRRIDVQRSHLRYLKLAQHRINDELDRREFRGLTVAIPRDKFDRVREKIRRIMDEIRQETDGYEEQDSVVRIQLAAYFLTD